MHTYKFISYKYKTIHVKEGKEKEGEEPLSSSDWSIGHRKHGRHGWQKSLWRMELVGEGSSQPDHILSLNPFQHAAALPLFTRGRESM